MGKIDSAAKKYLSRPDRFADAFNFFIFEGEQVINPAKLKEMDTTAIALLHGNGAKKYVQKYRDLLKLCTIMEYGQSYFVIFGVETQSYIDYSMPVRNMLYDAVGYHDQVTTIVNKHKEEAAKTKSNLPPRLHKDDRLRPIVTLTILLSPDKWDGAQSLHELITVPNKKILDLIPD